MTAGFDRVRPRAERSALPTLGQDAEGKRALFSSTEQADRPGAGAVEIACPHCEQHTVLSPARAVRAAIPSLLVAVDVAHGDRKTTVGVVRRRRGILMRCPACRRRGWLALTVRV